MSITLPSRVPFDGSGGGSPLSGPKVAGLTAGPIAEVVAKRRRNFAMVALGAPLILLFIAMYLRLYDFTTWILGGLFGAIFPAVIITLLAGLLWWALHRASRGNSLGERLLAYRVGATETEKLDTELHRNAMDLSAHREEAVKNGRKHLLDADLRVRNLVNAVERGRKLAAGLLNVKQLPRISAQDVCAPDSFKLQDIAAGLDREEQRGTNLDPRSRQSSLQPMNMQRTPWRVLAVPPAKLPRRDGIGSDSLPIFPPSALDR